MVFAFIVWLFLSYHFWQNGRMIRAYECENYGICQFTTKLCWNFTQRYIPFYNQGNVDYQEEDYQTAVYHYEKALQMNPPEPEDCRIRINLVLALLHTIDWEELDPDSIDDAKQTLERAKGVLCENGCASSEEYESHCEDAETLKMEMEQLEHSLEEVATEQESSSDESAENEEKEEVVQDTQKNQELESKEELLKSRQEEALMGRQSEQDQIEAISDWLTSEEYYFGDNW